MTLLGSNAKLLKHNGEKYLIAGLTMAPHTLGGVGNVCESATAGCKASCVLWFTGRTVTESVRAAMIRRTQHFASDPQGFTRQLHKEINRHVRIALKGRLKPLVRLNVGSDLDWSQIAREHPDCTFYDYTKVRARLLDLGWPENYHLTYSRHEKSPALTVLGQLDRGGNVAAVFSTRYHPQSGRIDPLPAEYTLHGHTFPVVDGDAFDPRLPELDGRGVIVGLRFKGSLKRRALAIRNGFCLEV